MIVAPEHHMNPPENDNLPPEWNQTPPAPIKETCTCTAPSSSTTLKSLIHVRPPPEVEGLRERRLPLDIEKSHLPVGPTIAEVEEDLQDAEMAEIAYTFAPQLTRIL